MLGKEADFLPDCQIPFCQQLLVGSFNGDLADFEMFGQQAFGGKFFTAADRSGENIVFDGFVELFVKRLRAAVKQIVGQHGKRLLFHHHIGSV